jgi:hypothetical protein
MVFEALWPDSVRNIRERATALSARCERRQETFISILSLGG